MSNIQKRDAVLSLITEAERVITAFSTAIEEKLESSGYVDLSFSQAMILCSISTGQNRPSEIRKNGIGQGTNVSYGLSSLEKSGYVSVISRTDKKDKRAKRFSLTDRGRSVVSSINRMIDRHAARVSDDSLAYAKVTADSVRNVRSTIFPSSES